MVDYAKFVFQRYGPENGIAELNRLRTEPMIVHKLAKLLSWALLAYVVFVTLGPVVDRPQFGYPNVERFLAFAAVGNCFAVGYPRWWKFLAIGLVITAGLLQAAQNFVPHRDAHLLDFEFKALGGLAGIAVSLALAHVTRRDVPTVGDASEQG